MLRLYRNRRFLGLLVIAVALSAIGTANAQYGSSDAGSQSDSGSRGSQGRITDPYEGAMKLMAQGNYKDALQILKAIANNVPDSEIALLQIGHCYINLAESATDPAAAQRNIDIGAGWILQAAGTGLRDAQEELVQLYLDGKIFMADPPEAGKWYLVWKQNRSDVAFGIGEFNRTLEKRLKLTLSPDNWRDAQDRAKDWQPVAYVPTPGRARRG